MSFKTALLEPRMIKLPPFTVEVAGCEPVPGETIPRRNVRSPDKLVAKPAEDVATILDIVTRSARIFGDRRAVGTRKLIRTHEEVKKVKKVVDGRVQDVDKTWTYFELSGYSYLTFKEYETRILELGAGLRKLGLVAQDRIHIFASTSINWLSIAHGAMSQSMAIVTAYDTLGEDGLRHSLVSTRPKAIFLEPHLIKLFAKTLDKVESIKFVVYNDMTEKAKDEDRELLKTHNITLLGYEEIRDMGRLNPVAAVPPKPEDLCCIMYTSGSGGAPKGVPLKHSNIVAAVSGASSIVGDCAGSDDVILAYLPLAHIFEFVFENLCIFWGGLMGYGSPRTLSAANCRNCLGDIQELKPTLLVGAPAVWEMVKKGIIANVNKAVPSYSIPGSHVLDAVVFKKVKAATGGRMRLCMNGSAPIAKDTHDFISVALCPMLSGYGMTETAGMGAICDPLAWTSDAHGDIPTCIEIKLVDFPEAGYYTASRPRPQGEVWIRGPSVPGSYYENEMATAESVTPDGWFKTGDIGEWTETGHLKIIDRKKNLVKSLNGEYIAIEKLESVYRSATVVANICVYASTTETQPIALIVPAEPALIELAKKIGVEGHGIGDLVQSTELQKAILKDMQAVGKKAGLVGIEIICDVVLADEEWTPQNGLLTATMKLDRRAIQERYKKAILDGYKRNKV